MERQPNLGNACILGSSGPATFFFDKCLPHSQIIGCGITQPLPPYNDEFVEFTLYSSLDFHQIQIPGRVTFELNAAKGPPSHHPQNREVTEGVFHVRAE